MLALAAAQDRILVIRDFRTMPRHFAEFLAAGRSSPGVSLVKQRTPLAAVIENLVLIWTALRPEGRVRAARGRESYRRHPKPRSAGIVRTLRERGDELELFSAGR